MKTLRDIGHLDGVKVLVRADFNVPMEHGEVVNDFRIRQTLPTIDFLRSKGAKVILMSHLETLPGEPATLEPVARRLEKLGVPVMFVKNLRAARELIDNELKGSSCMLLENLRQSPGEKANDKGFAKELASLADIYVNDAFSVCHRSHASVVGVPEFLPSYAGIQLEKEVTNLSKAFTPNHPFLLILGGAKFETKLPLLSRFMDIADQVFVGGALANDFYKAKGYETGTSLLSKEVPGLKDFMKNPKLILPPDVIVQDGQAKLCDDLSPTDKIMDDGPQTLAELGKRIDGARFILWNGPLGMYENGYKQPTLDLAKLVGAATGRGATTIVGGGDTLAAIAELGIEDKFTFVSTGGGAMLDFLAQGTLPGIEALENAGN